MANQPLSMTAAEIPRTTDRRISTGGDLANLFVGTPSVSPVAGAYQQCRLFDLDGSFTINFMSMPEDISDTESANYSSTDIVFRKGPIRGYAGSAARQISFNLQWYASIQGGDGGTAKTWVQQQCYRLKALTYPDYAKWLPPHRVRLMIGKLIPSMTATVDSVGVSWRTPFQAEDALPLYAETSITLTEINKTPPSCHDLMVGIG